MILNILEIILKFLKKISKRNNTTKIDDILDIDKKNRN